MIFPRFLHLQSILILGISLTAAPLLAQTAQPARDNPAAAPDPTVPAGKVVEGIMARVNDQVITHSDYQRALQQLDAEQKQQSTPGPELEDRKNNVLRDLIDQQLLLSKGKELGITGENDLVRELDQIRKQNHLDSMEDLEKAAQAQGVSYEDFKANIRNSIITQQVVRDQVRVSLSTTDVEQYFKAHESEFAQPEAVRLNEILIPTPAGGGDDSQIAAAQAKADEIEKKLEGGAKFEDLAKTSSGGPNAAQGGALGEFRRGMLAKELEDKTFSLQAGQYTAPIRTKQGMVILQVSEHTPGGDASFAQVRPQVEEALYMERMQPALRQYLTKLREEAYVELEPGAVDTGASPNEIHLTYSAYVPPGERKKKHFERKQFRGRTRSPVHATQTAGTASAATGSTVADQAGAADTKKKTQVAEKTNQKVLNPGKREKIRFGQAPRESLPPARTNADAQPETTQSTTSQATTETADAANPNVRYVNPDGSIGSTVSEPVKPGKTRFSDRAKVHKVKHSKSETDEAAKPAPAAPDETATQKVQDTPLGLAPDTSHQKKIKKKGDKTRYSDRKEPEQAPQQPYTGSQQPQTTGAPPQTPPSQPASQAPATQP